MMIEVRVSKKIPSSVTTWDPMVMDWLEQIWTDRVEMSSGKMEMFSVMKLSHIAMFISVSLKVPAEVMDMPLKTKASPGPVSYTHLTLPTNREV